MNIAIIPARGGSKRIPRKNIKLFDGKPMIACAITAAKDSGLFEHIVVSTEDDEIASVAESLGAETPFVRPSHLADDHAETVPVVTHGIQECRALGWEFKNVCCIYPCVPFIQIEDLQGSLNHLEASKADYCFPVTKYPSAIQRALKRNNDGIMQPFYTQFESTRTQNLEPSYHDAGQFYWGRKNAWLENPRIHSGGLGYIIPSWRSVDIDTSEDWLRAEIMHKAFNH
tara:strand:+ start:207 stop:890 length:684 start_codon:yes stop_codon:yes gene_type:complete